MVTGTVFFTTSLASSFNSASLDCTTFKELSIILQVTTSNNTGTIVLQSSPNNSTWTDIVLTPTLPTLSNSNATFEISFPLVGIQYLRVKYTASVGANGELTCSTYSESVVGAHAYRYFMNNAFTAYGTSSGISSDDATALAVAL